MHASSPIIGAKPNPTDDTPTVMVLHHQVNARTAWQDLTGKLALCCRLVRVELSDETTDADDANASAPGFAEGMVIALGDLVTMLTAHTRSIHVVSDSYGRLLVQSLAKLHPQSVCSISLLDALSADYSPAQRLMPASVAAHPSFTEAAADGRAWLFLAILRRHFSVEHRMMQLPPARPFTDNPRFL